MNNPKDDLVITDLNQPQYNKQPNKVTSPKIAPFRDLGLKNAADKLIAAGNTISQTGKNKVHEYLEQHQRTEYKQSDAGNGTPLKKRFESKGIDSTHAGIFSGIKDRTSQLRRRFFRNNTLKDHVKTVKIADNGLLTFNKMSIELITIFATTVLLWVVLSSDSITNNTCDFRHIFNSSQLDQTDSKLIIDCSLKPLVSASEFSDYWDNLSSKVGYNITGMTPLVLKSLVTDINLKICPATIQKAALYFTSGILILLSVGAFTFKYLAENICERIKDFDEYGTFLDHFNSLLMLIPFSGIIGSAMFFGCLWYISANASVTGFGPVVQKICVAGEQAEFARWCFQWFITAFGVCSALAFIWAGYSYFMIRKQRENFLKWCGLQDEYEQLNNNPDQRVLTHSEDPFFKYFDGKFHYDSEKFLLSVKIADRDEVQGDIPQRE